MGFVAHAFMLLPRDRFPFCCLFSFLFLAGAIRLGVVSGLFFFSLVSTPLVAAPTTGRAAVVDYRRACDASFFSPPPTDTADRHPKSSKKDDNVTCFFFVFSRKNPFHGHQKQEKGPRVEKKIGFLFICNAQIFTILFTPCHSHKRKENVARQSHTDRRAGEEKWGKKINRDEGCPKV
ncbi:hypothetical protein TW95_gp0469 [Pandoravirus inopinatum]|uniref:Uncharacterized protein n=1 Tax=Pandoravirus inopinatum TaxID=1605721 RepID=A0A0B5IWX8_9VIRU|nr:hypothetical protein TW95_gp0469 [Pandoravirus inopinatum]AJF97203.1 hypothetical protein [Pandoravirus inopinatum]